MMFDDLIGKPFETNGRGPGGYDCYGLCLEVCHRLNIKLPELEQILEHKFFKIDKPQAGDIALITTVDGRHVGVMENNMSMMQVVSTGNRGVHRMKINHPWIKERVEGFYRYAR